MANSISYLKKLFMICVVYGGILATMATLTLISFQYLGLLFAFFCIGGTLIILIVVSALLLNLRRMSYSDWMEQVYLQGNPKHRRVIVRTKNKQIIFDQFGELIQTQLSTMFFYGHPILSSLTAKRCLVINNLTDKDVLADPIFIEGVIQFEGDLQYIETKNQVIVKGKEGNYTDIKLAMTGIELQQKLNDAVREAASGNPHKVKEKMEGIPYDALTKDKM